ncbi:MAG TPA: hypothetical protein VJX23_08270 [Candidatus Binataceae bacterium]|nr:hypothetical protein [Candidatus Binataceae bacterium]
MADLPAMDGEPLPCSGDHQEMYLRGERMEAATNKGDASNRESRRCRCMIRGAIVLHRTLACSTRSSALFRLRDYG